MYRKEDMLELLNDLEDPLTNIFNLMEDFYTLISELMSRVRFKEDFINEYLTNLSSIKRFILFLDTKLNSSLVDTPNKKDLMLLQNKAEILSKDYEHSFGKIVSIYEDINYLLNGKQISKETIIDVVDSLDAYKKYLISKEESFMKVAISLRKFLEANKNAFNFKDEGNFSSKAIGKGYIENANRLNKLFYLIDSFLLNIISVYDPLKKNLLLVDRLLSLIYKNINYVLYIEDLEDLLDALDTLKFILNDFKISNDVQFTLKECKNTLEFILNDNGLKIKS